MKRETQQWSRIFERLISEKSTRAVAIPVFQNGVLSPRHRLGFSVGRVAHHLNPRGEFGWSPDFQGLVDLKATVIFGASALSGLVCLVSRNKTRQVVDRGHPACAKGVVGGPRTVGSICQSSSVVSLRGPKHPSEVLLVLLRLVSRS